MGKIRLTIWNHAKLARTAKLGRWLLSLLKRDAHQMCLKFLF